MTGQILARLLMWGFIIAAAWYFSQQYRNTSPTPEQESSMQEAARMYSEYKQKEILKDNRKRENEALRSLAPGH